MSSLSISLNTRKVDQPLVDELGKLVKKDDPKQKYVNFFKGAGDKFYVILEEKRFNVDAAKPTERVDGLALKSLEGIKEYFAANKTVELVNVSIDETTKAKSEVVVYPVTADKADLGKYILISAAADKIHSAANAKVFFLFRWLDKVWSILTCGYFDSKLSKINKLYNEIIKTCQTEYDKLAPKEDPKKKDEPAKT